MLNGSGGIHVQLGPEVDQLWQPADAQLARHARRSPGSSDPDVRSPGRQRLDGCGCRRQVDLRGASAPQRGRGARALPAAGGDRRRVPAAAPLRGPPADVGPDAAAAGRDQRRPGPRPPLPDPAGPAAGGPDPRPHRGRGLPHAAPAQGEVPLCLRRRDPGRLPDSGEEAHRPGDLVLHRPGPPGGPRPQAGPVLHGRPLPGE